MVRAASSPPPSPIADEREMRSRRRSTNNEYAPLSCSLGGEGGRGERSLRKIVAQLLRRLLICAAVVGGLTAFAQPQDFPTLKGDNARTGHNNSPATGGPGVGNLMWFKPNQGFVQLVRQVMNEAAVPPESTKTGNWTPLGPATFQDEALMVFAPFPTGDPVQDNLSGFTEY